MNSQELPKGVLFAKSVLGRMSDMLDSVILVSILNIFHNLLKSTGLVVGAFAICLKCRYPSWACLKIGIG